jgi:hypothetical protein
MRKSSAGSAVTALRKATTLVDGVVLKSQSNLNGPENGRGPLSFCNASCVEIDIPPLAN